MQKKSKLQAILQCKCPRCHQGDLFETTVHQNPMSFMKMPKHCPKCGLRYEIEPGFFYGAMYISYAFSVAIVIVFGFATYFIANDPEPWLYLVVVSIVILFLFPYSFRYSRTLMLHIFSGIRYQSDSLNEKVEE